MAKGKFQRVEKVSTSKKIGRAALIIILVIALLLGAVVAFVFSKLGKITYDDGVVNETYASQETEYENVDDPTDVVESAVDATGEAADPTGATEEVVFATEAEEEEGVNMEGLEMVTAPNLSTGELMADKDVMNILLLGTDERQTYFNTNSRSDVTILVSINKKAGTVKLVSFSRCIAVPFMEGQYKGKYEWLTNLHRWGGANMVMLGIEECFKIECDYFVRVNFQTVKTVVDAIGGIDIELTKKEADYLNNFNKKHNMASTTTQKPCVEGMNNLDGGMACHYARLRAVDDDWVRMDRQRAVILAAVEKMKGSDLMTLNNLADLALPYVQTNMSTMDIAKLIMYAPKFLDSDFDQLELPLKNSYKGMTVMSGAAGYALDYNKNNAALHEFLYGTTDGGNG